MTAAGIARFAVGFLIGAVFVGYLTVAVCATTGQACGWVDLALMQGNGL